MSAPLGYGPLPQQPPYMVQPQPYMQPQPSRPSGILSPFAIALLLLLLGLVIVGSITLAYVINNANDVDSLRDQVGDYREAADAAANAAASAYCHDKTPASKLCVRSGTPSSTPPVYDYVIVGAGAGGSLLAARLAASDCDLNILVLEAGDDLDTMADVTCLGYEGVSKEYAPFCYLFMLDYPDQPDINFWRYLTTPQVYGANSQQVYPRASGAGGSTSHHAEVDTRGDRRVFDRWVEILGDSTYSWQGMHRVFRAMENHTVLGATDPANHGTSGWLRVGRAPLEPFQEAFLEACEEYGMPLLTDTSGADTSQAAGAGPWDQQAANGKRSNAFIDLLARQLAGGDLECDGGANVEVKTGVLVTRVLFDSDASDPKRPGRRRAIGVEYIEKDHAYRVSPQFDPEAETPDATQVYVKREVVLAAGAINTPQLLMLSGVGPRQHLEEVGVEDIVADLPGVGEHLVDHLEFVLVHQLNQSHPWQDLDASAALYVANRTGSWTGNLIGAGYDWYSDSEYSEADPLAPDCHVHSLAYFALSFDIPSWYDLFDHNMTSGHMMTGYHTSLIEVSHPQAESGSVRLANLDPSAQPLLDVATTASKRDVDMMAGCLNVARDVFKQDAVQSFGPRELFPGILTADPSSYGVADFSTPLPSFPTKGVTHNHTKLLELIAANPIGHHISGTAKMGTRCDPMAVTDTRGRVWGLDGLRVVDSSLFPTITGRNPSRTVYAVAQIIAESMIEELADEEANVACD